MFDYPVEQLKTLFAQIIQQQLSLETWAWLQQQESMPDGVAGFNKAFMLIPRKTGKALVQIPADQSTMLELVKPGFSLNGYTIDRLCRVWLLLQLDSTNEELYFKTIEQLFNAAEVNELVALYGALPVLAHAQKWTARCSEGIRSNIGSVLETIICNSPYPAERLNEAAWNQLVLKAFFTEKDINSIIGLDTRANKALAHTLVDYAHERWAASRPVHPQLWRCVAPFVDAGNFEDIITLATSENDTDQKAAMLACFHSHYPPAKTLLLNQPQITQAISDGTLTWLSLSPEPTVAA